MDRLAALLAPTNTTLNGIDFVEIATDAQTSLVVHFLNTVDMAGTLIGVQPVTIAGGETVATVPVEPIAATAWSTDADGRPLLALQVPYPGDFSFYQLAVASTALDPFYAAAAFSFKARCPTDLDCDPPTPPCPPLDGAGPPIDYLAKDFTSFCQALSEYSTTAYPDWVERDEADIAMMLLELLAATADDLSYQQDRIAAEAALGSATERRSLVRLARLVDYEPQPAISARVSLQVDVATGPLPPGALFLAPGPDGTAVSFEAGTGMIDRITGDANTAPVVVDPRWNARDHAPGGGWRIVPYWWDDSRRCLEAGATEAWVLGHGFGFPTGDPDNATLGLALLVDTAAATSIDPPIRELVHLIGAAEERDPLFGVDVTHLQWSDDEALLHDHDLTRTHLAGNVVPATEGRRYRERFSVAPAAILAATPSPAVVRTGPDATADNASPQYLHTLLQGRQAWLPGAPGDDPIPEIVVTQLGDGPESPDHPWRWRRRLLEALPFESAYTIDPARFVDIRGEAGAAPWWEYDGDDGDSIRFGDGVFGDVPVDGSVFEVTYRVGNGATGNVAADTITGFDPSLGAIVLSVTNPWAAAGGSDEEPAEQVRRLAPYAFRARQFRAVRPEDYHAAAKELPWVLQAGTQFRWTGSWLTVFTTADRRGAEDIPIADHLQLIDLLNRRRMAGYESYVPDPQFVGVDLIVTVCAEPWAFRGEVEAAVLVELSTATRADGQAAFFALDNFAFGTALERSALEAAIQRANGVGGVVSILYRRRGLVPDFETMPATVTVGRSQILRVDNDPSRPERGSLRVVVEGGK